MSEERKQPELLVPPFWGNSDLLPFIINNHEIRTMYCYFPVFTANGTIIVVDPYEPTEEITTIVPNNNEIADRFLAEGDLLAVCAVGRVADYTETEQTELETLLKGELRKGLQLHHNRGELIHSNQLPFLTQDSIQALENIMTYEDRISDNIDLYLFIHNSTEEQ